MRLISAGNNNNSCTRVVQPPPPLSSTQPSCLHSTCVTLPLSAAGLPFLRLASLPLSFPPYHHHHLGHGKNCGEKSLLLWQNYRTSHQLRPRRQFTFLERLSHAHRGTRMHLKPGRWRERDRAGEQ